MLIIAEYNQLGRPNIPRPERFWLAADHVVDPRVNHLPKSNVVLLNLLRTSSHLCTPFNS